MNKPKKSQEPRLITSALLRRWPLPQPQEGDDKDGRGQVLVVGGSPEIPGGALLAATAALRAGAGRVRIATVRSIAPWLAVALPEARVIGLDETQAGGLAESAAGRLLELAERAHAVLVGPGLTDEPAVTRLLARLLPGLSGRTLILDAAALACLTDDPGCLGLLNGQVILTPHALEMALMLKTDKASVTSDPAAVARRSAADLGAVVTLKGADTFIAAPGGDLYCNRAGTVGLATGGSGDTLAGLLAGLAARGADPLQAAVWAVSLHARAGERLAKRVGRLGFLAHELLPEIPGLLHRLADETG